jgi:hypothetical protein
MTNRPAGSTSVFTASCAAYVLDEVIANRICDLVHISRGQGTRSKYTCLHSDGDEKSGDHWGLITCSNETTGGVRAVTGQTDSIGHDCS